MPRYSTGGLSTAGSTTLPICSLYASASVGANVREIGVSNTQATAVALKVVRLTTAGTQGAALTKGKHDPEKAAAACAAYNTHTVAPTLGDDMGYRCQLGAAVGSPFVFVFGDSGIRIEPGTTNGLGVIVENGTGQACQFYIVWDE